jgi:carbon-monoxide dehydrogenase medium subunit
LYLNNFMYYRPRTLNEACSILKQSKNGAPIAGGTDVLVELKKGLRYNEEIVSLAGIQELKSITENESSLYIGACATHNEVSDSSLIKTRFPAISEAASKIGTHQIRNTGTIGGNLCTGASCCDMAPILIALNAVVEIVSPSHERTVSLKDFFIFHKETAIKKGEIMTRIMVPLHPSGVGTSFEKFGLREASSISVASVSARITSNGNICTDSSIVIGAVAPTPRICSVTGSILNGKTIAELIDNSSLLKTIGEAAVKDSLPVNDLRGSAEFRRHLVNVLTQRAVIKAATRLIKSSE